MIVSSALMLATLGGCSGPTAAERVASPSGQACARAYDATVGSVSQLFERRGGPSPTAWPDQGRFVRQCLDLDMTEAQLACLDPGRAASDPDGCAVALESAKEGVDALSRWFNAELKRGRDAAGPLPDQVAGAQEREVSGGHE